MSRPENPALLVVLTTAPDLEAAERLVQHLVDERQAACANLLPGIRSIYRWKGAVERDDEVLVLIKTGQDAFESVRDRILELHPYDVPEVLALPVPMGAEAYVAWALAQVEVP